MYTIYLIQWLEGSRKDAQYSFAQVSSALAKQIL